MVPGRFLGRLADREILTPALLTPAKAPQAEACCREHQARFPVGFAKALLRTHDVLAPARPDACTTPLEWAAMIRRMETGTHEGVNAGMGVPAIH